MLLVKFMFCLFAYINCKSKKDEKGDAGGSYYHSLAEEKNDLSRESAYPY